MDTTNTVAVIDTETAEARVARGYAWLVESGSEYGLAVGRVDPATMAITDGYRCVLAQASGAFYTRVIDQVIPRREADWSNLEAYEAWTRDQEAWATAHGFLPARGAFWGDYTVSDVDALTEAWRVRLAGV